MRRRRPFSFKGQLEMTDDPVDCLRLFDKRYDSHLTSTGGAQQRIHFIDFADHLSPGFGGHKQRLFFNDRGRRECRVSLAYLSSVGIGVKAVVADHDLAFVRNMGSDSGDELQIVHRLLL